MIAKIFLLIVVVLLDGYEFMEMKTCPVKCFFTTKEKDLIKCSRKTFNAFLEYVHVECVGEDDMTIGNLESVRSLDKDFLLEMSSVRFLTINLNLATLEPKILSSEKLLELKLAYVERIHRDSFINLPGLESINFGRINKQRLPEFIILKYLDRKQITAINMDIECYKCEETSTVRLVFPKTNKKQNIDLYDLQSIDDDSCPINNEIEYCNKSSSVTSNKIENYGFLKLNQYSNSKETEQASRSPHSISMFYIGLIICLAIMVLIVCLLVLQLWTICQLRKATKILRRLQFYPALADSELSDNNESNSYYGNNGILYQHNFPISKT